MIRHEARNHLKNNNWGKSIAVTIFSLLFSSIVFTLLKLFFIPMNEYIKLDSLNYFSDIYINKEALIEMIKKVDPATMKLFFVMFVFTVIIMFIIYCPFKLGISRFYYFIANGESPSADEIFYYFKSKTRFIRSLNYGFRITVRLILWFLLLSLPGMLLVAILGFISVSSTFSEQIFFSMVIVFLIPIVNVIAYVIFAIIWLRYFLSDYLVILKEDLSVSSCIKMSFKQMVGFRLAVFKLFI